MEICDEELEKKCFSMCLPTILSKPNDKGGIKMLHM
jgi:hypothetical protein